MACKPGDTRRIEHETPLAAAYQAAERRREGYAVVVLLELETGATSGKKR
jgi:hypothetical protein